MSFLYHTVVYDPLYNGLMALFDTFPWLDAGFAVIIFTVIVKLILFPLSKKAVKTQMIMRLAENDLKTIKEKFKDKREQAVKTMEYYKEKGINPFSSILLLFIQLPILIALYSIFMKGFMVVNENLLYSFVKVPESINTVFIGLIDITDKSYVLAILAAVTQFGYAMLATPKVQKRKDGASFGDDMARNMQVQMKYVFPVVILFISYQTGAALALYWVASNVFMIGQELVIRRQLAKENNKPIITV